MYMTISFTSFKKIVHNFSSNNLSQEEINALSNGLDYLFLSNNNKNSIVTEFELFFQNLLKDISNMPEIGINKIKTKLRNTCEKYCSIKVLYAQRKIISNLLKLDDIVNLKQGKGRGVVIMDKTKYTDKCFTMFLTNKFLSVENNPTNKQKYNEFLEKFILKFQKKNIRDYTLQLYVQEILMGHQKYIRSL